MKKELQLIQVKCPECGHEFDLQTSIMEGLRDSFELQLNSKYDQKLKEAEKKLRTQLNQEVSGELDSYKEELKAKILETKELRKAAVDYQRIKREKDELEESLRIRFEAEYTAALEKERKKLRVIGDEKSNLKIQEKEMVITQLKEQLTIAQRKANQGSMQIQGEVQELSIESILTECFPIDFIQEVKKGVRGADCQLRVMGSNGIEIGSILIESKRTKIFQNSWIDKLKADLRECKATFGILVSDALPKDAEGLIQIKGIWVTNMEGFKSLVFVLREAAILLNESRALVGVNKGKMEKLYNYLLGPEFKGQVEAIVQTYMDMQNDLNKEQRAIQNLWKSRQGQLEAVLRNISGIYSSCRGITGNALGELKQLSL